jgi:D-alanine--poly(phosphoribitol) ligase subunit 1
MLEQIAHHLQSAPGRPAIHVAGQTFTYGELGRRIAAIQFEIERSTLPANSIVGVMAGNHLDTYAALLAILFSGHAYLPIHPTAPLERNASIAAQAGIGLLLAADTSGLQAFGDQLPGVRRLDTAPLDGAAFVPTFRPVPASHLAYLLFTSGSTGIPKGVPISRANLEAFLQGLFAAGVTYTEQDRVLQMFDLTFDFSVMSVFAPLVKGASIYVAAGNDLRFMSVYRLLEEQQLTSAPMVPSALAFLRPYFGEIRLEALRSSVFCGEPLLADIAREWATCTPNAELYNFYGPTEATVFCSYYRWSAERQKAHNGALSIGRAMLHAKMQVFDENAQVVPTGAPGEICLAGAHLTSGYWHDEAKNRAAFFNAGPNGERYYRTGDLGYVDPDGDFLFLGRVDQQVKVQGFRIELSEVEHHARACAGVKQAVALALPLRDGNSELVLCLEAFGVDTASVAAELTRRLPHYMRPGRIVDIEVFPLNKNGKIDRPALKRLVAG